MYSLVALLAIPATTCFLKAYALDTDNRRPWIAGFAVSVAVALYTHNWPIFFTVSAAVAWALLWWMADKPRRKQLLRDGLLGFGGLAILYLPWVPTTLYQAAHTGAPWADAPAFSSLLGVPGVLLGNMPQIVLLICAGAGPAGARAAAAEPARPRRRRAGDPRRPHAHDRVDAVAGLTGLGQPLPGGRAAAVPAAGRGWARARSPARIRRARAGGDHVGAGRRAGGEEQRPRDRAQHRAEPRAGRPDHLHPARDRARPALLPAGRAALRHPDRRADRGRRVGLARRRRAAGSHRRPNATSSP